MPCRATGFFPLTGGIMARRISPSGMHSIRPILAGFHG
jgi:hypothetical protein